MYVYDCDESPLPGAEPDCPACSEGPGGIRFMGILGTLEWFECRACGMRFSVEEDDDGTA